MVSVEVGCHGRALSGLEGKQENKGYMDSYRDRIVMGSRSIRSHTVLYCTVQYLTRPVPYPTVSHSTAPHSTTTHSTHCIIL
jgi:hypothetical protein